MPGPIAVAIASHARPIRLRWLLNALEEQTAGDFEVVVAHDSGPDSETERLVREHPVVTRHLTFDSARGPAELRNAAWRATTAPSPLACNAASMIIDDQPEPSSTTRAGRSCRRIAHSTSASPAS